MRLQKLRTRRGRGWTAGVVAGVIGAVLLGLPLVLAALGVLLGLVAAALAVAVALGPWLALGYLTYRLVRRSSRRRAQAPPVWAGQPWSPPGQPAPVQPIPAQPQRDPRDRLPEEQRAQVDRIQRKAAALLQRAEQFPTGSRNLHLVQRTLDTYLPSTLDAYLALAPGADDWVVAPDGRTGLQVLRDQLTLLEAKLDEVNNDLWQADVQRLLANERFLEEHFGRSPQPDELTIR